MENLKSQVLQLISENKSAYIDFDESGKEDHRKSCGDTLKKLRKVLKILNS